MKSPIVSVLMTAFNRQDYIAQAIESVLASTLQNFELVIVDDRSADTTVEIAETYALRDGRVKVFVNEKNLGDYPNRNKAASLARGKYIKYVDSDDLIYPHALEVMVKAMEAFPDAGYGLSSVPDSKSPFPSIASPKEAYLEHFLYGYAHFNRSPGSAIIRRDIFEKVGGFSGKRMIGDNEMWFKLSQEHYLVKYPRDLMWHRSHENQESQSDYSKQYEALRQEVTEQALNSAKCPLSTEELLKVRNHLIRSSRRKDILRAASKLKVFFK